MTTRRILVIGGSSGGLDALLALVTLLPDTVALPIVVVLHLAPHHRSFVPELIERAGKRRAMEVEDKAVLEPGTIFVAPPDYHVLVERGGWLALSIDAPVNFSRPSIDALFESAAAAYAADVIAIVLSGANRDGAHGLACVVRAGGLAIVQDPRRAQHATMPVAARESAGPSARVLDVPEMATLIAREVMP
jgi:two-component system chemotaxis response regulator CheB